MSHAMHKTPVIFILFGAAGDLSHRHILPALQALTLHRDLPATPGGLSVHRIEFRHGERDAVHSIEFTWLLASGAWHSRDYSITLTPARNGSGAVPGAGNPGNRAPQLAARDTANA